MATVRDKRKMYWIMMYATGYILENLQSLDFLNSNVKKVNGKTPFYDDETPRTMSFKRKGEMPYVRTRTTIHLKDSWVLRFSVREKDNVAIVKLSNTKRSKDGWDIANLLWEGTRTYNINVEPIVLNVPVMYNSIADLGVLHPGGWKGLTAAFRKMNRLQGKIVRQTLIKGHHTGAMTFYNRYTNRYSYNRTSRLGIRDQLVTSFREYIVLCVENGVRKAIEFMTDENILHAQITNVRVRVLK
jgi:hypothetical protein